MATVQMKIQPFQTPNFAIVETPPRPRQDGIHEKVSIALADLDPGTLAELCDDWRREVFQKAGKRDPHVCVVAEDYQPATR